MLRPAAGGSSPPLTRHAAGVPHVQTGAGAGPLCFYSFSDRVQKFVLLMFALVVLRRLLTRTMPRLPWMPTLSDRPVFHGDVCLGGRPARGGRAAVRNRRGPARKTRSAAGEGSCIRLSGFSSLMPPPPQMPWSAAAARKRCGPGRTQLARPRDRLLCRGSPSGSRGILPSRRPRSGPLFASFCRLEGAGKETGGVVGAASFPRVRVQPPVVRLRPRACDKEQER